MTATRRREGGASPLGTGSAGMRGMLLIALAVALGAGLLAKSFGDGGPLDTGNGTGATRPGETGNTTPGTGGTNTSQPPTPTTHALAQVKVLVMNGSGKTGIAKLGKDLLSGKGYTTLDPKTAGQAGLPTTSVYYAAEYEADAAAIAAAFQVDPATTVKALPNPLTPDIAIPDGLGDANVVVVIGLDAPIAGGTPASTTTATTAPAN